MKYIYLAVKLIVFIISTVGYWKLLSKKTKIDMHFFPALTICIQIFILFFAGILNCLFIISLCIYVIGIGVFVYYCIKEKRKFLDEFKSWDFIILAGILMCIAIVLKGKIFIHYDNFSHWAIVVKDMLTFDRYPNFKDTFILFQEYPLGSSTYIYYMTKMISQSESMQMFAQSYMIISFIFPIMKYIKKNRIVQYLMIVLFIDFILCYNIAITELLVDTLLAVTGFFSVLFVYEKVYKDYDEKNLVYIIPIFSTLVLIKNSGIFFIVINIILMLKTMKREKCISNKKMWLAIFSPIITYFLWNRHCAYVFNVAKYSKHAMTASNYINGIKEKGLQDILYIVKGVIKNTAINRNFIIIVIFTIIIGIIITIFNRKNIKNFLKLNAYIYTIFISYLIGLIGMYIFSMPLNEALAAIERYEKTMFIFMYLFFIIEIIKLLNNFEYKKIKDSICIIAIICLIILVNISSFKQYKSIFSIEYNKANRDKLESIVKENNLTGQNKYLIAIKKDDFGYNYHLLEYLTFTSKPQTLIVKDSSILDKYKDKYDYLINLDTENEILRNWIQENYQGQENKNLVKLGE